MWNDSLEKKCRYYQELANYKLMPNSYVIFHLDGRSFSNFCKRFEKPYDERFMSMMNETAKYLMEEISNVKFAYVQSDEITLIYSDIKEEYTADMWFGNRLCKMCSIASSLATSKFMSLMYIAAAAKTVSSTDDIVSVCKNIPLIQFDCKVWNVPSVNDAMAWLLYRQIDCIRNSKQMLGHTYLSHSEMLNKSSDEIIKLVADKKNIDWNRFNDGAKFGRFIYKASVEITTPDSNVINRKKVRIHEASELTNESRRKEILEFLKN